MRKTNPHSIFGAPVTDRAILVRINNAGQLARDQGGDAGALLAKYAPETIEKQVYSETMKKLQQGFADQKVDATVQLVSVPYLEPISSNWLPWSLFGLSLAGLGGLFWWYGRKR